MQTFKNAIQGSDKVGSKKVLTSVGLQDVPQPTAENGLKLEFTGVDSSQQALDLASQNGNSLFGDLESNGRNSVKFIKDNYMNYLKTKVMEQQTDDNNNTKFDVIIAGFTLHHLSVLDKHLFFLYCNRLLSKFFLWK